MSEPQVKTPISDYAKKLLYLKNCCRMNNKEIAEHIGCGWTEKDVSDMLSMDQNERETFHSVGWIIGER